MKRTLSCFMCSIARYSVFTAILLFTNMACTEAQTQQPLVVAIHNTPSQNAGTVSFLRDDNTGVLTLLPNSDVNFVQDCQPYMIEPKQKFLYGVCGDGVSMYSLDGSTGIVTEIPTSPFIASTGNYSNLIIAEATGQYVYLLKITNDGGAAVTPILLDTFQVDRTTPALVPINSQALPFTGELALNSLIGDPNGHGFRIFLNQNQGGLSPAAVMFTVLFDPTTGLPTIPNEGTTVGLNWNIAALSPKGNYLVTVYGADNEFLSVSQVSTTDFHIINTVTQNFGQRPPNTFIFFDNSGELTYSYIQTLGPTGTETNLRIFNSSNLTETAFSPLPLEDAQKIVCVFSQNPYSNFNYCPHYVDPGHSTEVAGIDVYETDPITGFPEQSGIISSTFYPQLNVFPAIYTGNGSGQPSSGPALDWNPTGLTFSATYLGQPNGPQMITLKSLGEQAISLSTITITGANAADFTEADTCTTSPVLQKNATCTISVTFTPTVAGTSQATLNITDNAPSSPQHITLTGMGVTPTPAVTLSPLGTLNFPGTTTQGTSSSPQSVSITNTGHSDLHVTNVALGNFNSNDFSLGAPNCVGTLAPNASCAISITFSPLASGIRTTSLTISDDAPNSPQVETINGNATIAATLGAAPSGTTSATVPAGGTAQYMLQIAPAQNFSGTISLSCSGAPLAATCQVPPTVPVTGGVVAAFTVSVKTSGKSSAFPMFNERHTPYFPQIVFLLGFIGVGLVLYLSVSARTASFNPRVAQFAFRTAFACLVLFFAFGLTSCGGGSSNVITPPPVQVVTPAGTSTITITPTGTSSTGKPIQLAPIQLTLTVQ